MRRVAPLGERMAGALRLAPLTVNELARCLGVTYHSAWRALALLRASGAARAAGLRAAPGRAPMILWCLAPDAGGAVVQ